MMDEKADIELQKDIAMAEKDGSESEKVNMDIEYEPIAYTSLFRYTNAFEKLMLFVGILLAIVNGAAFPLFAYLLGLLFDAFGETETDLLDTVSTLSLYFVYVGIGTFVATWLQTSIWRFIATTNSARIRDEYFNALLRKSISWFDLHDISKLTSTMDADCNTIADGTGEKVTLAMQNVFTFLIGIISAFLQGWELSLIILSVFPLIMIGMTLMLKALGQSEQQQADAYSKAGSMAYQALENIRTVASFNAEKYELESYRDALKEAEKDGIKRGLANGLGIGFVTLVNLGSYGLALWYGARLIIQGRVNTITGEVYSGGDVISIFFSVLIGAFGLGQAAPYIPDLQKAAVSGGKVFGVIDNTEDDEVYFAAKPEQQLKLENIKGEITLEKVCFAYPSRPEVTIFDKFDLKINPGETVALVGESGSGKSTIVQLIERFYNPTSGCIKLDNVDINDISIEWLRSKIGLVSQEPILFHGTIRENIMLGKPSATEEEMIEACKLANAHEFISELPSGYDTIVFGSVSLSGGQKQRIAIARAIIKKPFLLLLDEATSALDNQSEAIVQKAIDQVMENCTTIVIAHRLSTIRGADRICAIKNGAIVEQGTHDELLKLDGLYKVLVDAQLKAEQKRGDGLLLGDKDDGERKETLEVSQEEEELRRQVSNDREKIVIEVKDDREKSSNSVNEDEKDKDVAKENAPPVTFMRVLQYAREQWFLIALAVVTALLEGSIMPFWAVAFSDMVTAFYNPNHEELEADSYFYMGLFFAIAVGTSSMILSKLYLFGLAGEHLTYKLRDATYEKFLRQHIGWYDLAENNSGILASRLSSDANSIHTIVVNQSGQIVQSLALLTVGLGIAFYKGWQLTLTLLVMAPIMGAAGAAQSLIFDKIKTDGSLISKANAVALESTSNIRTLKAFQFGNTIEKRFKNILDDVLIVLKRKAVVVGFGPAFGAGVMFLLYALCFWLGAIYIREGFMDFNEVLGVFFAVMISFTSIGQLAQFTPSIPAAKLSANAVFQILDQESEIDPLKVDENNKDEAEFDQVSVQFLDVNFRYPTRPDSLVLSNLKLDVKKGATFALVGFSGSGKSTVIALIQRFYDVCEGSILINNKNIKDIPVQYLRKHISVVSQEPTLFNKSIFENVAYGKVATTNEVEMALKEANALEFVKKLPNYLDTEIGSKGIQLSGGQRQRIAIARAILADPKLLLLDEATSALDNESEVLVQQALDKLMKGRTTIVIAHRLSTIQNADQIAVMEKGAVVEQGTHQKLMEAKGIYANLVKVGKGNGAK